ncbi:MAG: hypothetical protein V7739_10795 [Motiliproteus sp.]
MTVFYRGIIVLTTLLWLTACTSAQYRWQHLHDDSLSMELAKEECKVLANQHASEQDSYYYDDHFFHGGFGLSTSGRHSMFGYSSYGLNYDPYFDQQRQYFQVCMKARGWEKIKLSKDKRQDG